jgi:hypothetical protein
MKHRPWVRAGLVAGCLTLAAAGSAGTRAGAAVPAPTTHHIGFDKYSFLIDGKRSYLWSGEIHPYRLPSPALR